METAGRAVAQVLVAELPDALTGGVLIAAGAGNNGGDGWVLARALHAASVPVWVSAVDPKTDDAIDNRALARLDGVCELGREEAWPQAAVAVDALLGTGAVGPAKGDVLALAQRVAEYGAPIVAVDGPTGLDLTSGEAHGPIHARLTVTFGGARRRRGGRAVGRDRPRAAIGPRRCARGVCRPSPLAARRAYRHRCRRAALLQRPGQSARRLHAAPR